MWIQWLSSSFVIKVLLAVSKHGMCTWRTSVLTPKKHLQGRQRRWVDVSWVDLINAGQWVKTLEKPKQHCAGHVLTVHVQTVHCARRWHQDRVAVGKRDLDSQQWSWNCRSCRILAAFTEIPSLSNVWGQTDLCSITGNNTHTHTR